MLLDFELPDKGLDGQIAKIVASSAIVYQFLCAVAINDLPLSEKGVIMGRMFLYVESFIIAYCCGCR